MKDDALELAKDIPAREALLLDTQRWDEWLDLFTDDVVFWIPAWRTVDQVTENPMTELSLMYLKGIGALKERVWRARSGLSRASAVIHRTSHLLGSTLLERDEGSDDTCRMQAAAAVHVYDPLRFTAHCFFSRYEHTLRRTPAGWKIAGKRITLMNDRVPTMLDFYSV
jgi:benzoate/toluate 1,2-dioxygenase beta subunit